ncbi:molecular chaperone HtpG [Sulfidibacter corallicola]|uniref:Chaperone protein HtpG n=1 Tax=Sulfidibacter corallicola TaxID=2818388 RepID=A0A8A4TPJ0_SULCO|nr:molecular chaperone HtpG [Sulfidibacter corallicola]QTD50888.1 molecular chaperone HtpG [Sulfidibacter corallicola]
MSTAAEQQFEFKTEIKELLHLIVHTLYTHKEIFLRELLSNASDALSKVQFEALTNDNLYDKDQPLEIKVTLDEENKTLTVEDTGIGMSRDELIKHIGTIAHSGTKRFIKELKENQEKAANPELIGQFGVGFYSVFMVADKVTIDTKSFDAETPAIKWESDGLGSYTILESERRKRGTAITLHLKEEENEFVQKFRVESLIKQYSNFLPFPVLIGEDTINTPEALWRKSKSEIKEEEYKEFYKTATNAWDEPMFWEHFTADAPVQFTSVLYVPKSAPYEYYNQDLEHGLKLYVKRVFIQDDCKELVPKFMRFLKGVVESEDLPLNVSRETIQSNAVIQKINKIITKKFLDALTKMAEKEEEKYLEFWKQFGRYIKEGVHGEFNLREKLLPLLRFHSTKQTENPVVTLKSYAEHKVTDQKAIYYAVGESLDQLRRSPHLEFFTRNDIEVLLVTEPMDDLILNSLEPFEELKFINVESGDLELPEELKKEIEEPEVPETMTQLKDKVREVLQDKITNVRFSKALTDSPCRFYNEQGGMSHNVRRMMFAGPSAMAAAPLKRDLELNPEHQFVKALSGRLETESINDQIKLLYHMASLLEGSVDDAQELASLVLPLLR